MISLQENTTLEYFWSQDQQTKNEITNEIIPLLTKKDIDIATYLGIQEDMQLVSLICITCKLIKVNKKTLKKQEKLLFKNFRLFPQRLFLQAENHTSETFQLGGPTRYI